MGTPGINAPAAAKSVSQVTAVTTSKVHLLNINNLVPTKAKPDFDKEVLQPLRRAQAAKALADAEAAEAARVAAEAAIEAVRVAAVEQQRLLEQQRVVQVAQASYSYSNYGTLIGSIGYAFAGGNCVNQIAPGVRPDGNPSTWAVTTMIPYIGAAALFPYNHVARVTGIWSNGDVEVANENWNGSPVTRFSRSALRGFR